MAKKGKGVEKKVKKGKAAINHFFKKKPKPATSEVRVLIFFFVLNLVILCINYKYSALTPTNNTFAYKQYRIRVSDTVQTP